VSGVASTSEELVSTATGGSRRKKDQSGAAALEFGLIVGTILIPMLLGVIQYGWYFYVSQTAGGAATHITRRMAVGDCWGTGQALAFVKNEVASNATQTTFAVAVSPPSPTATTNTTAVIGATQLTVTVTADGDLMNFLPMPHGGTITRSVSTMIEDTTSSGTC
jgi:Flp pilus assembly protein TadG